MARRSNRRRSICICRTREWMRWCRATATAVCSIQTRRKSIKPRGPNQASYVRAIQQHDANFGIGPAGTGKTYLAVACAVAALEQQRVGRILLVRPAVEAGEKLGFLPGDLAQKIDPYLRPLYDALYEMMGVERVHKYIERNVIEVAPLAFMRGRTLNNSFIILDESQNTTIEQMKMFLTRIGFGSTAVITGDITQIDLPRGSKSGLIHVMDVLAGVEGLTFTHFTSKDVVRHPLVQRIVEAYARHDDAGANRRDRDRRPSATNCGAMASPRVDVQIAEGVAASPRATELRRWARAALGRVDAAGDLCIRIVDAAEMSDLNARFRGKNGTTNVLSFPADAVPPEGRSRYLGDVVICAPVVAAEAAQQRKSVSRPLRAPGRSRRPAPRRLRPRQRGRRAGDGSPRSRHTGRPWHRRSVSIA